MSITKEQHEIVIIGGLSICTETNSLRYNGVERKIEPRLLGLLLLLNASHGKVVTKEEIMGTVWEGTVVTDDSLTKAVSKLRKVLEEYGESVLIETVRGRGYVLKIKQKNGITLSQMRKGIPYLIIAFLLYLLFGSGLVGWIVELSQIQQ